MLSWNLILYLRDSTMGKRKEGVYIPLHEVARVYGYTRDHLGYLIRKGELKGQKLGSFYSSAKDSKVSSSAKNLNPYFTTQKWMEEYLIKSGKARKRNSHIKQSISSSVVSNRASVRQRSSVSVKNLEIEGMRLINEFKKELLPLWQDLKKVFNDFKKNFSCTLNSVIFLLKNINKEVKAWQIETKYLIKRIQKKTACSKIINNTIELVRITLRLSRRGIDLIILAFRQKFQFLAFRQKFQFLLPKKSIYQLRRPSIRAKCLFSHSLTSFFVDLKKAQREILWRGSIRRAKNQRANFFRHWPLKFNPKFAGLFILLIGLALSSLGIYISSLKISETFNATQIKLANTLDKISMPVYMAIDSSDRLAQINKILAQLKRVSGPCVTLTPVSQEPVSRFVLQSIHRNSGIRKRFIERKSFKEDKENLSLSLLIQNSIIIKKTKNRIALLKSDFNKMQKQFNRSAIQSFRNLSFLSLEQSLSVFGRTLALRRTLTEKLSEAKQSLIRSSLKIKNLSLRSLYIWQSSNNLKIAQIDNKLTQIKTQALTQINKGSQEQLAKLNINFSFIKKPFIRLKSFIASRWGLKDRVNQLEKKIAKIEQPITTIKQDGEEIHPELSEGPVLSGAEGLIVIPSTEYDEENKKKIKSAFSDEVTIEPDETGKSGIIRPVFRKPTDQKYLYLLVPMAGK